MFRNDRAITPLRLKQAIDSRFIKTDNGTRLVLIDGKWVEFYYYPSTPINCTELLTMYKGDTTLTETPVINATGCMSLSEVFRGCTNLKTVKYIHTPNVETMVSTFRECSSLITIPKLDTSSVYSMNYAFLGCSSLITIPKLDMGNVETMHSMFYGCSSLTSVPEMNISNEEASLYQLFSGCSSLTSVSFIGNVVPTYGSNMFLGTPINAGNGYIFVPDNLVNAYKTAFGWSRHASVIKGISEKEALQSNIDMYNMQIKENPSMFAPTEEEKLEMMRDMEEGEEEE